MSYIVKCRYCEPNVDSFYLLKSYLPEDYEYMVCSFTVSGPNFKTRLRTNGKGLEYAHKWLEDFQMHSKCTMRVERTYPHSGTKNVFKIDLRCQHNTRPRSEKVREKESCKNTDCPAKMGITIKRVVTERKSRSKDPHLPIYPTVLQMDFCHNHPISTPEILRHRSVLPEVRAKILNLFKLGHNPATALDMHKYDLQLEHGENYGKVSQDRAILPDQQFCYRLYYKIVRRQAAIANGKSQTSDEPVKDEKMRNAADKLDKGEQTENVGPLEESSVNEQISDSNIESAAGKKTKKKRKLESTVVDKCEMTSQLEDLLCKFCESGGFAGMQLIEDNTVMAFCSPLMHRVHTLVNQSAELVFVDSYGELDEPNSCKVMMFVTYSSAGALPLGCLVTTSASSTCIKAAVDLWKQILPDGCFFGRTEGPHIFLINDNEAERQSLKVCFPESHLLVCLSHVLQSSWILLWDRKTSIKKDHRSLLFSKIKMLLFSQSIDELEINYAYIMQDSIVKSYSVFVEHFNSLYEHRRDWSLIYRQHLMPRSNDVSLFWEVAMILLKDPILSRTRTFNQLQVVDFLSRMDTYYERRLIDMANSRLDSVKNSRFLFIEMPQEAYTITQRSESEYEVHNDTKDTTYQVDITLGMCECRTGRNGSPCKHQLLVFRNFAVPSYDYIPLNTQTEKDLLLQLATGQKVDNGPSTIEVSNTTHVIMSDSCSSEVTMHDLTQCNDGEYFLSDGTTCDTMMTHAAVINSHIAVPLSQSNQVVQPHNPVIDQQIMLSQQMSGHEQQQTVVLSHDPQTLTHHNNNLNQNSVPQISQNVVPMNQPEPSLGHPQQPVTQSNHPLPPVMQPGHQLPVSQPEHPYALLPPPPPPLPPIPPEINQLAHPQNKAVHDLINKVCEKLKERTSRMPQTFIPALDTFLKNLDKLSSDSSLEYALYSFGKFSKSAMPLFRRRVVNNRLIGLQSAGSMKKKPQHAKSSKVLKTKRNEEKNTTCKVIQSLEKQCSKLTIKKNQNL